MNDTICKRCNDTHIMISNEDGRNFMCTHCPVPCQKCRVNGNGPYCQHTPCDCECHKKDTMESSLQNTKNAILDAIQPGALHLVAEQLAKVIHIDPCRFLSATDAEALRRGLLLGKEAEDRKDAIIAGLNGKLNVALALKDGIKEGLQSRLDSMTIEMDRKDAIISGLMRQRDIAINACGAERDAHIADCNSKDSQINVLKKCLADAVEATDNNFNRYKNACEAVSDLDIKYAKAGSEIRDLERELETYRRIKGTLEEKIKNQRERINYLEGATNHACGTPLTVATKALEAEKATTAELRGIVEALRCDIHNYQNACNSIKPGELSKLQSEMFGIKMLLRARGHSNYDDPANKLADIMQEERASNASYKADASRWRALLASARIRPIGSAGIHNDQNGYAHLSLELWTIESGARENENLLGRSWLTKYADIMVEVLEGKHK